MIGTAFLTAAAGATFSTANNGRPALSLPGTITGGWPATGLSIPSAQSCTIILAYQDTARGTPAGRNGNGLVEVGPANYFWNHFCQVIGNQTGSVGANPDPDGPCVLTMTSGAGGIVQRLNGVQLFSTASTLPALTVTQFSIGGFFDNASYPFGGYFNAVYVIDGVLSAPNIALMEAYALSRWPGPFVGTDKPLIVWDGNSIPAGVYATANVNQPSQVALATLGATNYYSRNLSKPGAGTGELITNAPTWIDPLYSALRTKSILLFHEISNDIASFGATGATSFSRLKTYANARKAVGWKVILLDCLPRASFNGTQEGYRTTCNASLAADFTVATTNPRVWLPGAGGTYADALVQVSAIAALSNTADTTYYADGTHPTNAAYVLIAADCAVAVPLV